MLLPISWLKTFLPKLPSTPKLVETLMMHGLDVERVISGGKTFNRVVVGEIVAIRSHPNADKLQLADVVLTQGGKPQEIVCGAPNIAVGQKVPVALVGSKLPNGLTIEPRAIRGVTSNGMICAADELGLGSDRAGILVLDPTSNVGTPFAEVIGAGEVVIDLAIPANRSDLMSMRGLAWEIGAMLGQTPRFSTVKVAESQTQAKKSVALKISNPKLCSLLMARVIRGVTIKPTPAVIVNRLRAAGMRPVNIVADIANYVMLDYGQPLHAYDAAQVRGGRLIARPAKAGEQLKTLDGKMRSLAPEMLVIADAERVIGVAGVMGGAETEVTAATTDIILEAAIFDPVAIRQTSRQLGLISEASKRFEKGLWPEVTVAALNAAAAMMVEYGGGTIESGIIKAGPATATKRIVKLPPDFLAERIGMAIPLKKSKEILGQLGFTVAGTAKSWTVTVPAWRPDVALPEDIIDEIGRLVGYEQLPKKLPSNSSAIKEIPPPIRFKEELKNILVDLGFTEVISHAFYSEKSSTKVTGKHFEVANPLDSTQHKLRKSLWPQIQEVLKRAADAGRDAEIFEIGLVFDPDQAGPVDRQQYWKVALGQAHKGEPMLKRTQQVLQQRLGTNLSPVGLQINEPVRGRTIEGCEFDLRELTSAATIEFGPWDPLRHSARKVTYREPSKYPAITRDVSFWWPSDEKKLFMMIADFQKENSLLWETQTKDTFTKDGKTSYLVSFIFQSPERTLTKTEIDDIMARLESRLKDLGATIR